MQQNQPPPPDSQSKPTTKPPLPSPSSIPQSHKRLLVNPPTPSPQSSLSSDSSSDDIRKKTRDLPNLYDCLSCDRHVNFANPSDRLRILDSAWRVVLLCKECFKRVELGRVCSYCLETVKGVECFKCGSCERLVHRKCVVKYGVCAPWSYCPVELRYEVCVDCWVPNSVRRMGKGVVGSYEVLEDCVREAECEAGRKLKVSVNAKVDAVRKRDAARKAVDFANGVLEGVKRRDGSEDGQLALQLHRAMNSSPRISRSFGPVNYSCLGGGNSRKLGFFGKMKLRGDKELDEIVEAENEGAENGMGCRGIGDTGVAKEGVIKKRDRGVNNETDSALRFYQRRKKQKQILQSVGRNNQNVDKNFQPELKCYQRQRRNKLKRVGESEVKSTQSARNRILQYYSRRKQDRFVSKYRRTKLSSKGVSCGQRRNFYDSLRPQEYVLALPTPGASGYCQEEPGKG